MDNKGQSLVAFIFILPIIILILLVVIDYGQISIQKQETISSVKDIITYALRNNDANNRENEMKNLLYKNIDESKVSTLDIEIADNKVTVNIIVIPNEVFNVLNIHNNIKLSYVGKIENNQIIIEES